MLLASISYHKTMNLKQNLGYLKQGRNNGYLDHQLVHKHYQISMWEHTEGQSPRTDRPQPLLGTHRRSH
jgi:hypothetical protein